MHHQQACCSYITLYRFLLKIFRTTRSLARSRTIRRFSVILRAAEIVRANATIHANHLCPCIVGFWTSIKALNTVPETGRKRTVSSLQYARGISSKQQLLPCGSLFETSSIFSKSISQRKIGQNWEEFSDYFPHALPDLGTRHGGFSFRSTWVFYGMAVGAKKSHC